MVALEAYEVRLNPYFFQSNFVLLDVHYFPDRISDVKLSPVFDEIFLVFIQQSVIQDVVHEEVNELWGREHLRARFEYSSFEVFEGIFDLGVCDIVENKFEALKIILYLFNLPDQRAEGISQLVRHCRIYES